MAYPKYEGAASWDAIGSREAVLATLIVIAMRRWGSRVEAVDEDGATIRMGSRVIYWLATFLTPSSLLPLVLRVKVSDDGGGVRVDAHAASDFIEDMRPSPSKRYAQVINVLLTELRAG